jgi:hypothetical protein
MYVSAIHLHYCSGVARNGNPVVGMHRTSGEQQQQQQQQQQ